MYLIVDTETNDLPRDWRAPATDVANWPRVVQVAWLTFDGAGRETGRFSSLVQPVGFEIHPGAQKVHGISKERALREGRPVADVLASLAEAAAGARLLVAHNLDFDAPVLQAEFLRAGRADPLAKLPRRCTMKQATAFCNLPGKYGPKWPKLEELHVRLFAVAPPRAHDALADAEACARCFFELKRRGVGPFREG